MCEEELLPQKGSKTAKKKGILQSMTDMMQLCNQIRETAFEIHKYLRNGHLEKIYENALFHRC
jgi:hypothetical protein